MKAQLTRLRKWRFGGAVLGFLLSLGALSEVYDVKHDVVIPLSTIQASIDRNLPYRKAMVEVSALRISDAGAQGLSADILTRVSFLSLKVPANASGYFRLAYEPASKSFHLSGFDVRQVSLGSLDSPSDGNTAQQVSFHRLDDALDAIFRAVPVYRIHEDSLKGFFIGEALTDVQVKNGSVIATLQPMHAVVSALIGLVVILMLAFIAMSVLVLFFSGEGILGGDIFALAFLS